MDRAEKGKVLKATTEIMPVIKAVSSGSPADEARS